MMVATLPVSAQITIDGMDITFSDASKQSTAANGDGDLTNVTVVKADGTTTENGTALKAAMDAIINDGEGGVANCCAY